MAWRQTSREWYSPGDNWNDWPRIKMPGEISLVAYAPIGSTGDDDDDDAYRQLFFVLCKE